MASGFIYIWVNKINERMYIGSHKGKITDNYKGSGIAFKSALKKYGIDNFERYILESNVKESDLLLREQYYLDLYRVSKSKKFYNISGSAGGGRTMEGKTETELKLWREKCRTSQLNKEYTPSLEAREKMSNASKKYWETMTEEEYQRASNIRLGNKSNTGLKRTEIQRKHASIGQIKRYSDPKQRTNMSLLKTGKLNGRAKSITIDGIEYGCYKDACKELGISIDKLRRKYVGYKRNPK